jgi:hypothetical protein
MLKGRLFGNLALGAECQGRPPKWTPFGCVREGPRSRGGGDFGITLPPLGDQHPCVNKGGGRKFQQGAVPRISAPPIWALGNWALPKVTLHSMPSAGCPLSAPKGHPFIRPMIDARACPKDAFLGSHARCQVQKKGMFI